MRPSPEAENFKPLVKESKDEPEVAVDWDDEKSVHHRSAMNSLHNYAIGKMGHLESPGSSAPVSPQKSGLRKPSNNSALRRSGSVNISFANELHQTIHFERHSMECEPSSNETVCSSPPPTDADHRDDDCKPCTSHARFSAAPLLIASTRRPSSPPPLSPTTSEFVGAQPPPPLHRKAQDAERRLRSSPPRRCQDTALPRFPGPADLPADPADFPRIE